MRYRLQRHDGTDCSATMVPITVLRMVPIQRYRHPHALTAYITCLLLTVYVVRIKKSLSFMLSYSHNVLKYIST